MFKPDDEDDLKKAHNYINGRTDDFFTSSMYSNFVKRYEKRRDAYYMRPAAKTPKWRSRLTFATYFLGVKMLEAQLGRSYSGTPFVTVQLQPGSMKSPDTDEKLRLANFDLNRDIATSRFMTKFDRIRWYLEVSGIGVAREFFASDERSKTVRSIANDSFGIPRYKQNEETGVVERTVTEPVHPLNFAMEPTCHEIRDARWSAVRYPLKTVDLYAMLDDENYHREDVKKVIEKVEAGGSPQLEMSDTQKYYYDVYWDRNERTNNSIIVLEYAGDLNYRGNEDDKGLYYALILKDYQAIIRCTKSPYPHKPHWKVACYPDMDTPYGIDPCAMLMPIKESNDDLMNQYIDYVRSTMRVMYETYDGNIVGGLSALIEGKTFGFVVADTEKAYNDSAAQGLVRPVRKDQMGISGFQDVMTYLDRYSAQVQPASNLKGVGGDEKILNRTATGIGFQASREDAWVSLLRGPLDQGLADGMNQKLTNRMHLSTEEVIGDIGGEQYRYFPFETSGPDYEFELNKQPPDALIGRIQQAMTAAQANFQAGIIDMKGYSALLRKFFELSGVPGGPDLVKDPELPPQIGAPQSAGGPTAAPSPKTAAENAANAGAQAGTNIKGTEHGLQAVGHAEIPPAHAVGGALALA